MLIEHRWHRRQAQIMCEALRGRDWSQPSALIHARLRAMDALAFDELLLESFERQGIGSSATAATSAMAALTDR